MNRRGFHKLLLGTIATGFCAGLGAAKVIPDNRAAASHSTAGTSDFCLSPELRAAFQTAGGSWPDHLTLAGSRLIKNAFLDDMAERLAQGTRPGIAVYGGGCDDGILAVRARRAHIGNLCCPVPGSPAADLDWLPVGHDIKVVVAHPENPIEDVSLGALKDIARGRIRNWRRLGGDDRPIALVVHDHCPTYFEPVRTLLLDGDEPWSGHRLSATTDDDHLRQVARFTSSIGVNSWILAKPLVARGELKVLRVDGIAPTVAATAHGAYPLRGPFNMIFSHWHGDAMNSFFDRLYSEEGQAIVKRNAVPVTKDEALELGQAPDYFRRT